MEFARGLDIYKAVEQRKNRLRDLGYFSRKNSV